MLLCVQLVTGCGASPGRSEAAYRDDALVEIVGTLRDADRDSALTGLVYLAGEPFGDSWWPNLQSFRVDSAGHFAFKDLIPRAYYLGAMSAGYEQKETAVLPRSEATWVVELRLTPLVDSVWRGHSIQPPGQGRD
jgi:hypothetical protein